ncbi:unnamed protein product [Coregonus sp. 'balchen']|nr:unnamed protein product [Coregonus sp. 'balchen']
MTVFGLCDLLNDPGCKVVIYPYCITRALSACITCMLSVFQAVTIAPAGGPHLSRLKASLPSLIVPTFTRLWLLNMDVCITATFFSIARTMAPCLPSPYNVIWIYMPTVAKMSPMVADKRVFFSSCYASLSPFFIISSNKKVKSKLVCAAADQEQPSVDTQDFSDKI